MTANKHLLFIFLAIILLNLVNCESYGWRLLEEEEDDSDDDTVKIAKP